jgi:hypothetical protein
MVALAALLVFLVCSVSAKAEPLTLGFADDVWFDHGGQRWVAKTQVTGAKMVALEIDWNQVEPHMPTRANHPTSASDPVYRFRYVDAVLRGFEGTGLQPLLLITDAPGWAQGHGGSASAHANGAYKPNTKALRELMTALARRYSGSFPDPRHRHKFLPRVRYFQAWAEANMTVKLAPQWTREHGHLVNTGPLMYRQLLNSFYAGVKAGDPQDKVVISGLAPYGDPPGGARTPPVSFLRAVLCLNAALKKQPCADPPHFDILASDPYDEISAPTTPAANANDASAPDLWKLTKVVRAGVAAHTVLPASRKPLWVTEFSYDSDPPNPYGLPLEKQARWLEESFYVFWREHVSTAFWYLVRDQVGSFRTQYFSGVYFHNGKPKPALQAYRFPFVVMPAGHRAQVWGVAPYSGKVTVQRLDGKKDWKTVFSFQRSAGTTFNRSIPLDAHGAYRAVSDGVISLTWTY